jgi:hypothetical protein
MAPWPWVIGNMTWNTPDEVRPVMSQENSQRHTKALTRRVNRLHATVHPHPVEPGTLGEYVAHLLQAGQDAAFYAFPAVASHLMVGSRGGWGCPACNVLASEMRISLREELGIRGTPDREASRARDRQRLGTIDRIRDMMEQLPREHRHVVEARLGWLDGRQRTLAEVADDLSITFKNAQRLEVEAYERAPDLQTRLARLRIPQAPFDLDLTVCEQPCE